VVRADAAGVVRVVCEGLRCNDLPTADAGVKRLFHFLTPSGRVAVAPPPPRGGMQGGVQLDYFVEEAASPAIGALVYCSSYELIGEARISPGSEARGELAYQLIEVGNSPLEDGSDAAAALEALVQAPDHFIESLLTAVRDDSALPAAPPEALIKKRFWVSLEKERRPPLQDCWIMKELLPLEKSMWQTLNEGGEEFEGDDS
jgi:hypothetical protein